MLERVLRRDTNRSDTVYFGTVKLLVTSGKVYYRPVLIFTKPISLKTATQTNSRGDGKEKSIHNCTLQLIN